MKKLHKILSLLLIMLMPFSILTAEASADTKQDTYKLITEIAYSYAQKGIKATDSIKDNINKLKNYDSELGQVWEKIMEYWAYSNTDQVVNVNEIPQALPDDGGLCIVVLGYKLNEDGSMAQELTGRCDLALKCHEAYPNACIAVTGGGTALYNHDKTEAGQMADYLVKNGIERNSIIVEDKSTSTMENAEFLGKIILDEHPEIKYLLLVTSDYHVPKAMLMFREYFLLANYSDGADIVSVLSNAAYESKIDEILDTSTEQLQDVWSMAEYMHATSVPN